MARRRVARRTKTSWLLIGGGVAAGIAAYFLLPRIRQLLFKPSLTVGTPTIRRAPTSVAELLE